MTRILLDTEAMAGMAATLRQVGQEVDGISGRLAGDAAVLMPPGVAASVAAHVGGAAIGMRRLSGRYGASAGELDRRRRLGDGSQAGRFGIDSLLSTPWWRAADRLDSPFEEVLRAFHDAFDTVGFVSAHSLVSTLNSFDVPFIRIASNPAFRYAGHAFGVIGGIANAVTALDDSAGENWAGRGITVAGSVATDVLFDDPVVAAANFLSLGSLRADAAAYYTIGGAAVSRGWDRAAAAYRAGASNPFALGWNVAGAAVAGELEGASEGLDKWSQDVSDGKWGGLLAGISHAENSFIDDHYDEFATATRHTVDAISGAGHDVAGFVGRLF